MFEVIATIYYIVPFFTGYPPYSDLGAGAYTTDVGTDSPKIIQSLISLHGRTLSNKVFKEISDQLCSYDLFSDGICI